MVEEKVIDRIRKLMALAKDKGASKEEAAAALAKASDMMIRYNIDHIDEKEEAVISRGSYMSTPYTQSWELILIGAIAVLYDCRSASESTRTRWHFYGRRQNIEACEETLPYVVDQVLGLYKEALKARGGSMSKSERGEFRQTFKESCAMTIWRTVKEIKAAQKNQIPDHKALVLINRIEEELTSFEASGGYQESGSSLSIRKSGTGSWEGYIAGKGVRLQREVPK